MIEVQKTNIDSNGQLQSYIPAVPLGMTCEARHCTCSIGKDYKRKTAEKGWEDEPIFLCDEHSKGYILYS